MDNRKCYAWDSCEAGPCNSHVGRGGDYHYHGEPFGSSCLYTEADYTGGDPHSKQLGWGFDGFAVYGRYTSPSQEGEGVSLDACGGHSHGTAAYHYHPEHLTRTGVQAAADGCTGGLSSSDTYHNFPWGPRDCYKGDVSLLPNFYERERQPNYDNQDTAQGRTWRTDTLCAFH